MGAPVADPRTRGRLVAGILAGILAALVSVGCNDDPEPGPSDRPDSSASVVSPAPLRTDREPIARRFPRLGDFAEVHWQGAVAGPTGGSRVPGPSDVLIQAVVLLRPADLAAAASGYDWTPAPVDWDAKVSERLRPFLPASADWRHSRQYEADVRTDGFSGTVYLDLAGGTVYLHVNSR
jgi:hypothetical protein